MSLGYAEKLSYREDLGGQLGDPELSEESTEALDSKIRQLADWVRALIQPLRGFQDWRPIRSWFIAQ